MQTGPRHVLCHIQPETGSREYTVKTVAKHQSIPLPLILMSRPRRSRAKELAAVAGAAALLLAATVYVDKTPASGGVAAATGTTR